VGLTGLVVLFLTFDGIAKVMRVVPVLEACRELSIAQDRWHWRVVAGLHRPLRHTEDRDSRGDSADWLPRRRDGGSGGCSKRAFPHAMAIFALLKGTNRETDP
jgi:hypothetical protein